MPDTFTSAAAPTTTRRDRQRRESDRFQMTPTTQVARHSEPAGCSLELYLALKQGVSLENPSMDDFLRLPAVELAAWLLGSTESPAILADAAEVLGGLDVDGSDLNSVLQVLEKLLERDAPLTREGAIFGLGRLALNHPAALERSKSIIRRVSQEDRSLSVREAAVGVLEDIAR